MIRSFSSKNFLSLLSILLILKAIWAISEIYSGYINLDPDEAQYWTWSRSLDWGYYSKPPGISWQIFLGCQLFGNTELGVRFLSVIFSVISAFGIYYLALCCSLNPITAFYSAIILSFSPIGLMGTFAATTDGGLMLFWILACCPICISLIQNTRPNYIAIGLLIMLGAFFKWPIYILWVICLIAMVFFRPFRSKTIVVGILISLMALLPSIIWNSTHDWATFKHVFTQSTGGHQSAVAKPLFSGNFFDFLGAQFGVLSPILFILMILGIIKIISNRKQISNALLFCAYTSLCILALFLILSLFNKMQPNWALYAYPTGVIVLSWYAAEILKKGQTWIAVGLLVSLLEVFSLLIIPYIQQNDLVSKYQIPFKVNPFKHSLGWKYLPQNLSESGYNPDQDFLFADSYQTTAILSFYSPEQHIAYFLNLDGKRKNQYSYWPKMSAMEIGQTGYYLWTQNSPDFLKNIEHRIAHHQEKLQPYFQEVEFQGIAPLFYSYNTLVKGGLIFKCINYNGNAPDNPERY